MSRSRPEALRAALVPLVATRELVSVARQTLVLGLDRVTYPHSRT